MVFGGLASLLDWAGRECRFGARRCEVASVIREPTFCLGVCRRAVLGASLTVTLMFLFLPVPAGVFLLLGGLAVSMGSFFFLARRQEKIICDKHEA